MLTLTVGAQRQAARLGELRRGAGAVCIPRAAAARQRAQRAGGGVEQLQAVVVAVGDVDCGGREVGAAAKGGDGGVGVEAGGKTRVQSGMVEAPVATEGGAGNGQMQQGCARKLMRKVRAVCRSAKCGAASPLPSGAVSTASGCCSSASLPLPSLSPNLGEGAGAGGHL